jgi:hypothetical protein
VRFAHFLALFVAFIIGNPCHADAMHPQDGPHADLRVAIEDRLVRFSVGVNLVFLDETIDTSREAISELSPAEADRVMETFRAFLIEQAPCEINGEPVEPVFERIEIFTDPDPGMIAIFQKTGARALIRATVIMRYDAPQQVDTVDLTWPAYPFDQLAEEMEASSAVRPRMYFEAVLTAQGKSEPAKFTHAEPTLRWSRSDADAPDPLLSLPEPAVASPSGGMWLMPGIFVGLALVALGFGFVHGSRASKSRAILIAVALLVTALIHPFAIAPRTQGPAQALLSDDDAQRVLRTLHESMYRAFDYTAESDIYDRLAFALQGELLGELYEQIRLSLLQAEEEMKVGVVTGLQPIETSIAAIDLASETPEGLGFDATHRWRVDGTVYHWGHSHTRAHIYEARYRVTHTPDGWRFTDHQLLSQQRIDPSDGSVIEDAGSIQQQLDDLGLPDI